MKLNIIQDIKLLMMIISVKNLIKLKIHGKLLNHYSNDI